MNGSSPIYSIGDSKRESLVHESSATVPTGGDMKSSMIILKGWKSLAEVTIGPYLCDRLYRLIQSMPSSFGWQHIRFHRSIESIPLIAG
jgi:hypothetical protein